MDLETLKEKLIKELIKIFSKKGDDGYDKNVLFYIIENWLDKYSESTIETLWKQTEIGYTYADYEHFDKDTQIVDIIDEIINEIYDSDFTLNYEKHINSQKRKIKKNQKVKKINFDSDLISEIQKLQKITSQKLGKYIGEKDSVEIVDNQNKEGKDKNSPKTLESLFNPEESNKNKNIKFNNIQKKLLKIFINNNFELSSKEVGNFAKDHKLIKQQSVNNINEIFYESYEDNLIESTEDKFNINSFQIELLKKIINESVEN